MPVLTFATRAASSRSDSEDRLAVFEHDGALVIVVADGAGGVGGGAGASEAVIEAVTARVAGTPFDPYDIRAWPVFLSGVDADLVRSGTGGETTATIVVVGPYGLLGVSAGDSEAWVIGGVIERLTEKQARARIGTGQARPVTFHRRGLDGVLVVASDGLFRHARQSAIIASCAPGKSAEEIAAALVGLPASRSGVYPDDVALVVVARA